MKRLFHTCKRCQLKVHLEMVYSRNVDCGKGWLGTLLDKAVQVLCHPEDWRKPWLWHCLPKVSLVTTEADWFNAAGISKWLLVRECWWTSGTGSVHEFKGSTLFSGQEISRLGPCPKLSSGTQSSGLDPTHTSVNWQSSWSSEVSALSTAQWLLGQGHPLIWEFGIPGSEAVWNTLVKTWWAMDRPGERATNWKCCPPTANYLMQGGEIGICKIHILDVY